VPQIEVTFDIDANGIVNVSAKDLGTGKEQKITVTGATGLTQEEIDQMIKEAETHAEEDKRKREEAEIRNNADSLAYQTERSLKEHGDKLSTEDKKQIETALSEVKEALKGQDIERIKKASENLMQSSHKLAQIIYAQAQEQAKQQAAGGQTTSSSSDSSKKQTDEKVVDADYEVVDEEEKGK
jgi:molecular chaperone DnaK